MPIHGISQQAPSKCKIREKWPAGLWIVSCISCLVRSFPIKHMKKAWKTCGTGPYMFNPLAGGATPSPWHWRFFMHMRKNDTHKDRKSGGPGKSGKVRVEHGG